MKSGMCWKDEAKFFLSLSHPPPLPLPYGIIILPMESRMSPWFAQTIVFTEVCPHREWD